MSMTQMSPTLDARQPAPRRAPAKTLRPARRSLAPLAWLKRRFRARPGATLAHGAFAVAGLAILLNALFWQSGTAPRPAIADRSAEARAAMAPPAPPQRPAELAAAPAAPAAQPRVAQGQQQTQQQAQPAPAQRAPAPSREATTREAPRDQIGDLIRTGMVPGMEAPRPPAAIVERASVTASLERPVAAAQRALNKLGHGPVRTDGRFGEETRAAIERFERERRLPVTRDLTPRTLRELASASGLRME